MASSVVGSNFFFEWNNAKEFAITKNIPEDAFFDSIERVLLLTKLLKEQMSDMRILNFRKALIDNDTFLITVFWHIMTLSSPIHFRWSGFQGVETVHLISRQVALCIQLNKINKITLNGVGIDDKFMDAISEVLKSDRVILNTLSLSENLITSNGLFSFSNALQSNKHLTEIVLSGNKIGDYGLELLVQGIIAGNTVTRLGLNSIGITKDGLLPFIDLMKYATSLTVLDMGNNDMVDADPWFDFVTAVVENKNLLFLSLENTFADRQISGEKTASHNVIFAKLYDIAKKNTTLIELKVSDNGLGSGRIGNLITVFSRNPASSLKKLILSNNPGISSSDFVALSKLVPNIVIVADTNMFKDGISSTVQIATELESNG